METNSKREPKNLSAALADRIAAERTRLALEEKREVELAAERTRLLTAGSDQETDDCEVSLDVCRSAQVRALERIDILATQHAEALAQDESQRLDGLRESAEAARLEGVRLIRVEYPKVARAMAAVLQRLAVTESTIVAANFELDRAGRPTLEAVNVERFDHDGYMPAPLNETISLPSEKADSDAPAYWKAHETTGELVQFAINQRARHGLLVG